jgi:hypothetical protein
MQFYFIRYGQSFDDALWNTPGADVEPLCDITFHAVNGVEVCRIAVKPGTERSSSAAICIFALATKSAS